MDYSTNKKMISENSYNYINCIPCGAAEGKEMCIKKGA